MVYFRKKGKVHLSIVPMRSFYFEKYFTWSMLWRRAAPLIAALRSTRQNLVWFLHRSTSQNLVWFLTPTRYHIDMFWYQVSWQAGSKWFQAFAQERSWSLFFGSLPLERHLRIWILLNGDKWLVVTEASKMPCRPTLIMRGARFRDWKRFIKTTENAEDMPGNGEFAAFGSFARIWEDAARLVDACLCSSSSDTDGVSDPMDFDNEFLDALAHLDSAPAAPSTIKTF